MAAERHVRRGRRDVSRLEMTPMIDVVFQLLIFFLVTLRQEDILAQLQAMRPSPPPDEIYIAE